MSRDRSSAERAERLRSPLLIALWILLVFEVASGLVLFTAFLVVGRRPGETLHVVAGVPLAAFYAVYQWRHWQRVSPFRGRPDHVLGVVAATVMCFTLATGLALGVLWWQARGSSLASGEVSYPVALSSVHNIGSMLVMAFVGAHLIAVLGRDARREGRG